MRHNCIQPLVHMRVLRLRVQSLIAPAICILFHARAWHQMVQSMLLGLGQVFRRSKRNHSLEHMGVQSIFKWGNNHFVNKVPLLCIRCKGSIPWRMRALANRSVGRPEVLGKHVQSLPVLAEYSASNPTAYRHGESVVGLHTHSSINSLQPVALSFSP